VEEGVFKKISLPEALAPEKPLKLEMAEELLFRDYYKVRTLEGKERILSAAKTYLDGVKEEQSLKTSSAGVMAEIELYTSIHKLLHNTIKIEKDGIKVVKESRESPSENALSTMFLTMVEEIAANAFRALNSFHRFEWSDRKAALPAISEMEIPKKIIKAQNRSQFSLGGEPFSIILINAINSNDRLTEYLESILSNIGLLAKTKIIRLSGSTKPLRHFLNNNNNSQRCLLTVDSTSNSDFVRSLSHQIIGEWKKNDEIHVLDQCSDPTIRNNLTPENVHYLSFAQDLKPASIISELKLESYANIPDEKTKNLYFSQGLIG
jgi:hypothetical protein